MFLNRVKAKEILDGQEFIAMLEDGKLVFGSGCRCDQCGNLGMVNGGAIQTTTPKSELLKYKFVYSSKFIFDDIGADNETGGAICGKCFDSKGV